MDITALLVPVGLLLILFIAHNLYRQLQERLVAEKKQRITKYNSIINSTDDLLSNIHIVPYSYTLLLCLTRRILFALQSVYEIDKNNRSYHYRIMEMRKQIANLENRNGNRINSEIKIPDSDKQAIAMLRFVKNLKVIVKYEYCQGHLPIDDYLIENQRLDAIRVKINIENIIKRAEKAKRSYQYGTCIQLLQKGTELLDSRTDSYSKRACVTLELLLNEVWLSQSKNDKNKRERVIEQDKNSYETMFEPKKYW